MTEDSREPIKLLEKDRKYGDTVKAMTSNKGYQSELHNGYRPLSHDDTPDMQF